MPYCTWGELASELGITTLNEADKVQLAGKIAEAQAIIEGRFGTRWEALADTTRYFDPLAHVYGGVLYLGTDLYQITSITNGDGTAVSASQYITRPVNAPPYHALRLRSGVQWVYVDDPEDAIAITGRWAYSLTAPEDVKRATKRLAAWLYRQKDTGAEADRPMLVGDGSVIMPARLPGDVFGPLAHYSRYT